MKEVNYVSYYLIWAVIGVVLAHFIFDEFTLLGTLLFVFITCGLLAPSDLEKVEPNHVGIFINAWSNSEDTLVSKPAGLYWMRFLSYKKIKEFDSTKNQYPVEVKAQTKNNITITLNASLWASISKKIEKEANAKSEKKFDAGVRFYQIGDDVRQRILDDWGDTLKGIISEHTDVELRSFQNNKAKLKEIIGNKIDEDDSLGETLDNAGLEVSNWSIGEMDIPKSIQEANEEAEKAKRRAVADDFNNKEFSKRAFAVAIDKLTAHIKPPMSRKDILDKAQKNLNYTDEDLKDDHEKEFNLHDEALKIAKNKLKSTLSGDQLQEILADAEKAVNIREGRIQAYSGLGNATPIINASQGKGKT